MEDNILLTAPFDCDEVKDAVWECEGDKSQEPDGYNFKFIKSFWHLLKDDFFEDDCGVSWRWEVAKGN